MHGAELTDGQEDPYAIGNHGKGIPLGHALFSVQEMAGHVYVSHHQSGPVEIEVEGELRNTRPLESDGPHHFHPTPPIEHILLIREKETLVLLLGMPLSQEAYHVYSPFNDLIHTSTNLVLTASLRCLLSSHHQDTILHHSWPSSNHPHGPHCGFLAKVNHVTGHERVVYVLWGMLFRQPL